MSTKCRVDGCHRSKELNADGLCNICVRASTFQYGGNPNQSVNSRNSSEKNIDTIDLSSMEHMMEKVNSGEAIDPNELLKSVFNMVYRVAKSINSFEDASTHIASNTKRIEALEAKLLDEVSLQLGIVVINLDLPPPGVGNLAYAKALIKEINAPGVNCETDVIKAIRVGYKAETSPGSNDGRLGRFEIEVSSNDVKAKIT